MAGPGGRLDGSGSPGEGGAANCGDRHGGGHGDAHGDARGESRGGEDREAGGVADGAGWRVGRVVDGSGGGAVGMGEGWEAGVDGNADVGAVSIVEDVEAVEVLDGGGSDGDWLWEAGVEQLVT